MEFSSYLQFLISGLTMGGTYALIALGFTIIFNTTGIINFAQGEFVMLGGMIAMFCVSALHMPLVAAIACAVAAVTCIGAVFERFTIRPVKNPSIIQLIIITIGVSILLRGGAMLLWGKDTHTLPPFSGKTPIAVMGASFPPQNLWIIGVSLALIAGMKFFFSRTMYGKAMLACSHDAKAAYLVGISTPRMVLISFMISAFVGSVGGVILAPVAMTSYDVGALLGLKGFAACIVGGLGNPFGAAAGGLIIGVLESFGAGLVSSAYKDAFAFIILLVLLFIRPSGLFGRASAERA